jgi:hypothetical protein
MQASTSGPLPGSWRHQEARSPMCVDEAVVDPTHQGDSVINIEDLKTSNPLSPPAPPSLGEGEQGGGPARGLEAPGSGGPPTSPAPVRNPGRASRWTVSWELPKKVEVSASLLGAMCQVGTEIDPLQTFGVALLASVLALA